MMVRRPIRLLMTADAVGGVWHYATGLAAGLAEHGVETLLAILGPPPGPAQRELAQDIAGLTLLEPALPLDWLSDADSTRESATQVARLARSEGVDLVHLNSPALAAQEAFAVPVIGFAHGCLATWWQAARSGQPLDAAFRWHAEMMARGLRACDRILAPSASYAETLRRCYRLPASPLVVRNGRIPPPSPGWTLPYDCAFTAGRLWDEVKNISTLDRAAARLPFPFHAAGPVAGPNGSAVPIENLHLLGTLDSTGLEQWLARRPVFVSAAVFEPFGLAVLEAAGWGCPLVLSDIPTFRELWDGAAIFVAPGDAEGFAAAIMDCVHDLHRRSALGEAARTRAVQYTASGMASATAAQYRAVLEAKLAA